MKARLLKRLSRVIGIYLIPVGIVTLGLGSPSNANEQQSEVLTDVAKIPATTLQETSSQTATIEIEEELWGVGLLTERNEPRLSWGVFLTEDSNGERVTEVNLGLEQLQDVLEALKTDHKSPAQTAAVKIADKGHITVSLSGEEDAIKFDDKKIKLVLGSDDKNQMIHKMTSNNDVFISVSADDEEISALAQIVSKLTTTEWDQLSGSEKQEIINALEQVEAGIEVDIETDFGASQALVVVILILFSFGLPFIIIALILYYKHRKRRQRDLLITTFIEAGKDVPTELFQGSHGSDTPTGNIQRGIMLMAAGTGLFFFLGMLIDWGVASVALIPLFIGVARVVIGLLGKNVEKSADNP